MLRAAVVGSGSGRRRAWSPTWAVVLSVVAALAVVPVLGLALSWISDDLKSVGEKFDGLGLALGGLALVPVALTLLPLAWFWWRGGTVAFWTGVAGALVLGVVVVGSGLALGS